MNVDRMAHVERCVQAIANGQMIVMVDDEDRENEGDLVIAAEHCNAEAVNFMCREGRGLICLALNAERVVELGLPMMVHHDPGQMGTAFTVSIEARHGVTTGISASDRAQTIRVASDPRYGASDLVSPGHVFPLRAQRGGVLVRAGHTEGSVDIARMAGCRPAGVICEIMRDDGEMARMDDLDGFAARHGLLILTIADLIEYRLRTELMVECVGRRPFTSSLLGLQTDAGWEVHYYRSIVAPHSEFVAFSKGTIGDGEPVLLRAQRAQLLGDVFGDRADDSATRLRAAFAQIERARRGVVLYVVGADLGIGGVDADTDAPVRPREQGFRTFGLGAQVLRDLQVQKIIVVTNHPRKIIGLEGFGLEVVGSVPLEAEPDT